MARPKQSDNAVSAMERIENAFWSLLASNDYEKISIKMLAAEAKVNHNSIYYHYANMDEIAKSAFDNTIIHDLQPVLQLDFTNLEVLFAILQQQPDLQERFKHLRLFASAKSIYLQDILKNGLIQLWLSQAGKTLQSLSAADQLEVEFIFSAIIAVIGKQYDKMSRPLLHELVQRELAQTMLTTMKNIINK